MIREHFTPDFRRLLIDDTDAYEQVCTYLRATAPDLVSKVSRYDEDMPLFERYHVRINFVRRWTVGSSFRPAATW